MGSVSRRKLSIEDAPETIRGVEGELMGQVKIRLNNTVVRTIQQLEGASRASRGEGDVQILLNVLEECKLKSTTVEHQGEGNTQLRTEVNDRERRGRELYDPCKQVWEGSFSCF